MATKTAASTRSKPSRVSIPQVGWNQVRPAPVILVSGTETFLAERSIRNIRDFLKAQDPRLEVNDIQADAYALGELVTMASPSLFDEPRLIRVSSVEKCTDDFILDALRYLEYPTDRACLVLRHGGGVRGKKLLDAIRGGLGGGIEVICSEIKKDSDKIAFVNGEFAVAARRVTPGAMHALVAAFTDDLAELASACQQLVSDTSGDITEAAVDQYYSGRVEANAFRVADAAIAGRHGEALLTLRHALASGADPVPIVAAFAMKLRTMAKVHGARGGTGQLASQFGMAPWQVERARKDLAGWSDAGLGRCIQLLAETDANVKGGGRDPVFAIERMIGVVSSHGEA